MADADATSNTRMLSVASALADADRIVLLGVLARRELTSNELAAEVGLDAAVVSGHLATLGRVSLITTRKDGHRRLLSLRREALSDLAAWCSGALGPDVATELPPPDIPPGIRQFFSGGRLVSFPARHARKVEVLKVLVRDFELETNYTETEVNQILLKRYPDFATLRRALIDEGLMTRNAGTYRRAF